MHAFPVDEQPWFAILDCAIDLHVADYLTGQCLGLRVRQVDHRQIPESLQLRA